MCVTEGTISRSWAGLPVCFKEAWLALPNNVQLDRVMVWRYRSHNGYNFERINMKFVSARELRNRPGHVRDLARKDDLVLVTNGKPVAMLVGIKEDELEETARAIRQAKAQLALSRLRKQAARGGTDRLSDSAIDAEIGAVRSRRKST
jgi:prevent-host-death family protein